jgi:dienelactone hydrolase
MSDNSNFKPTISTSFAPGALGESADSYRASIARRFLLSSGTHVIHVAPDGEPGRAGIILFPSLRGHTPMFVELCTRLASLHGYEIVSPELFPNTRLTEPERIELCKSMRHSKVVNDARLAAQELRARPTVIMGFCLGGMFASLASDVAPSAAIVSFYGFVRFPDGWERAERTEPLDAIARSKVPLLGVFGRKDPLISSADVAALKETGARVLCFEEAGHAFAHDPSVPSYRPEEASHAWRQVIQFIESSIT